MDTTEEQRKKYFALAAEADDKASQTSNRYAADNWRSIAESYRALAK